MSKASTIRRWVIFVLYGIGIVGFIYYFYVVRSFVPFLLSLVLIYIMGFYFLIETGGSRIPYYKYVVAVFVSLGFGIALSTKSIWLFLAFWLWGLGVFVLLSVYKEELFNRRTIKIWHVFSQGAISFPLIIALLSGIFWINKYPQFNLNCNQLYANQKLSSFFSGIASRFSNLDKEDIKKDNDNLISKYKLDQLINYKAWYESLNENLVKERKNVYIKMCESVVDEIKILYSKPSFKLSVVFLLSLVFLPFVRMLFFLAKILGWLSFVALFRLWVYKKIKKAIKVEEIV